MIQPMIQRLWFESGFGQFGFENLVMICIGILFIFLAVKKGFEPLLLVPIGFGMLMGNIPYNYASFSMSVYDGPVSETKLLYYSLAEPLNVDGHELPAYTLLYAEDPHYRQDLATADEGLPRHLRQWTLKHPEDKKHPVLPKPIAPSVAKDLAAMGQVVMVHSEEFLTFDGSTRTEGAGVHSLRLGGHSIFSTDGFEPGKRYPVVVEPSRQDIFNASVLWFLFRGIEWGFYPPLIFLGVGALIDFGPLLANPSTILLGAAAQLGIFGALLCALLLGFDMREAASIGIIGGADGPTAIFTCTKLAPHLLGAVALAAYSYMAMVPIIQPPIMRLLTTRKERLIRMDPPKEVSRTLRIVFPVLGFLLSACLANAALPLLGMLFFGNLLRECLVTDRLAKTAQTSFIDAVTILLGMTVGAKTQAATFLTTQTLGIFVLGVIAFGAATAGGVLFGKLMNVVSVKFGGKPINPLIGAAGVSAVPMAARVVHKVAQDEDPQNYLLMHAMGPNVAGVIGSAVAAGVMLSHLAE